jgi:F0F1-type ATP synthase assembly protein I
MNIPRAQQRLLLIPLLLLVVLLTWPIWRWLWGEWWTNDYYGHGLLVLPTAVFLGWRRLRHSEANPGAGAWSAPGLLALAASLVIYLYFWHSRA